MKKAVAIRHVPFEDLGSFESLLSQHYDIHYLEAESSELALLENNTIDLMIILGGPMGVYEEDKYPFLTRELALLEKRLKRDFPTMGICLGSQLMAKALGERVYPHHTKEIGWIPLRLTEDGKKDPIKEFAPELTSMFHWHGDTFDLPKEAILLASTPLCHHQIYRWGKNSIAFQCHPEITSSHLEKWWAGHEKELEKTDLPVKKLREESQKLSPALKKQASSWLQKWLITIQHEV